MPIARRLVKDNVTAVNRLIQEIVMSGEDRLLSVVALRLTRAEQAVVRAAAEAERTSVSAFARRVIMPLARGRVLALVDEVGDYDSARMGGYVRTT